MAETNGAKRLREMAMLAGATDEEAAAAVEMTQQFVHYMARVLAANPTAPNHITLSLLTPGDAPNYELTIRKHGGTTPADRIAALEAENAQLRAMVAGERGEDA